MLETCYCYEKKNKKKKVCVFPIFLRKSTSPKLATERQNALYKMSSTDAQLEHTRDGEYAQA